MRTSCYLAFGWILVLAAGTSGEPDKAAPPPKASYVKVRVEVEIRGMLRQTDKRFTVASRFRTYELYHEDRSEIH